MLHMARNLFCCYQPPPASVSNSSAFTTALCSFLHSQLFVSVLTHLGLSVFFKDVLFPPHCVTFVPKSILHTPCKSNGCKKWKEKKLRKYNVHLREVTEKLLVLFCYLSPQKQIYH